MISFVRRCHGQFYRYMLILQNVTSDRLSTVSSAESFSFLIEALHVSTFDLEHFASHCRAVLSRFLLLQGAFRRGGTFGLDILLIRSLLTMALRSEPSFIFMACLCHTRNFS